MTANKDIVEYYTQAGPDYAAWSRNFNMHFGFWRSGMSLFDREAMLEQMNNEVFARGASKTSLPTQLLDLGCGVGTVARSAVRHFPHSQVVGITLVPSQVRQAIRLTPQPLIDRVRFVVGDYTRMPFGEATFDFAYALESSCYAPGTDKGPLIEEARRVLRRGGRLVIADAMLRSRSIRSPATRIALRALCNGWGLSTLGVLSEVVRRLRDFGFVDVRVEDISRNVTPSILHAPAVGLGFICRQVLEGNFMLSRRRWENALMSLPLFIFSLDRSIAGYFMISASRG